VKGLLARPIGLSRLATVSLVTLVALLCFLPPAAAQAAAAAQPPAAGEQPAGRQIRYWTTNWSFRDIDVGTLTRRLGLIGIAAPADLGGTVSVNFSVSVPINALRDAAAYRINGTLTSSRLRIESTELSLDAAVDYADGVVAFTKLTGNFFESPQATGEPTAGSFSGQATMRLAGVGDRNASVELDVRDMRLGLLTAAMAADSPYRMDASGIATGSVKWGAPVDRMTNLAAWDAEGRLAVKNLSVDRHTPLDFDSGPLRIVDGAIDLPNFRAEVSETADEGLAGSFRVDLKEARPWSIRVRSDRLPIDSIAALLALGDVPGTSGELTIDCAARGTLTPLDWEADAEVQSPDLTIYGVPLGLVRHRLTTDSSSFRLTALGEPTGVSSIRSIRADYEITEAAFDLSEIDASLFGGTVRGDARWARDAQGQHEANLQWAGLDLRWDVGSVMSGTPGVVSLRTEGRTAWQVAADRSNIPADHSLRALVQIDELAIAGLPISNGSLMVRAVDGELSLRGEGTLLGGTFRVDTATEIPAGVDFTTWWNDPEIRTTPLSGRARLQAFSLAGVGNLLRWQTASPTAGRGWQGRGDALIDFSVPPGGLATGSFKGLTTRGSFRVTDFAVLGQPVSPSLEADFRVVENLFLIDRFRANFAGGTVEASGRWPLTGSDGRIDVALNRVDLGRALLPLYSDAERRLRGETSGRVRLSGGTNVRMHGSIEGRSIVAQGFPVSNLRGELSGNLTSRGVWEVRMPNVRATVSGGRVSGQARLSGNVSRRAFDLQSRWSARHVNFADLLGGRGSGRPVGRGDLSATVTLDGRSIRSVNELTGRFDGRFGGTAVSAVPGLVQARSYLGPIGVDSLTFTDGRIRGQVRRGVAQVEELALRSDRLRVVASGSVRLENQRLGFDAVVATGDFSATNLLLDAAAQRLAFAVAPPIGLLLSLNRLISDRTLFLRIEGTAASPTVRVLPLQSAGENLLRYLLREATGMPDTRAI